MRIRHITYYVLAMLLLLSLALSAWAAGSAEINVIVPSEHTVTVFCGAGGRITVGETAYTGTNSFNVARHSDFSLSASPGPGYELVSVTGDSVCEMTFVGSNIATIKKLCRNTEITVLFRAETQKAIPVGIFIPITSQNHSIAAEAVITEDEASISLNEASFDALLEADTNTGTVSVDISNVGVNINTVEIPVSTVRAIAEKSVTDTENPPEMAVMLPHSEVTFDTVALNAIAKQTDSENVTLHVEKINTDNLTTQQQAAISDLTEHKNVVTVTLKSGDSYIRDFDGGSVDVNLPYTPQSGEDTETITVWFLSEDGVMEEIVCKYNNGFVRFTVFHFSEYLIKPGVIKSLPGEEYHCFICKLVGQNLNPWCWLIPSSVTGAVVVFLLILLIEKRRTKKPQ